MNRWCCFLMAVLLLLLTGCAPQTGSCDPLKLEQEIREDYFDIYVQGVGDSPEDWTVRFVYVSKDVCAVYLYCPDLMSTEMVSTSETVSGYRFEYPPPAMDGILIYRSGRFYKLEYALAKNMISEADLKEIHANWGNLRENLFNESR